MMWVPTGSNGRTNLYQLDSLFSSRYVNIRQTYTASYTITQAALDTGGVSSGILSNGSRPGQSNNVTDTSDDRDESDGNTEDDTTDTSIDNSIVRGDQDISYY